MKKIVLLITSFCALHNMKAQTVDTVSTGAGYANQIWYSLANDNQGISPKNNWDLAFDVSGFGSGIRINSTQGVLLYTYPTADTAGWSTVDTAGIKTWKAQYDSDTSWYWTAFDVNTNLSNQFDLGWGIYSSITHAVTGDSLYIIKLANNSYQKLWIEYLAGGDYVFRHADLDGNNQQQVTLSKSTYANKNFGYYSFQNNAAVDREPVSSAWDITFCQYTTFLPTPYPVTGILHNNGIQVAQADDVADSSTYINVSAHAFVTAINEIGYDWKTFTGSWSIADSLVYFVKLENNDIWKIVFNKFGGSSNGNFIFTKEKLGTLSINNNVDQAVASLSLAPNPVNKGNDFQVVYDIQSAVTPASLMIYNITGKPVYAEVLNPQSGLYVHTVSADLTAGIYFVSLNVNGSTVQQKLIIQ